MHLVFEGTDLELLKKSSLGLVHLVAFLDDLEGICDFDLGLNDLSLDVEGLEELGLLGVETSRTWLDGNILRSDHAWLGGGFSCLFVEDGLDFSEVTVREDHADIADELLEEDLEVGALLPSGHALFVVLIVLLWLFEKLSDCTLHVSLNKLPFWRVYLRFCP